MFIDLKLFILYSYSGIASTEAHVTLPLHVYVQLTHIPQTLLSHTCTILTDESRILQKKYE